MPNLKFLIKTSTGFWVERDSNSFSRDELRDFARANDVRRGRDRANTIYNLKAAGLLVDLDEAKNWYPIITQIPLC